MSCDNARDIGVRIESITCDGPSCYVTMLETLGATMKVPDLIPSVPHPLNSSHSVSVCLVICHMQLMIITPESNGIFKDRECNQIKWE